MNAVIDSFAEVDALTVHRRLGGSYVDGRWVRGNDSTIAIRAAVLPAKPREIRALVHLPEGQAVRGGILIYTEAYLRAGIDEPDNQQEPDIVVYGGRRWIVQEVSHRGQIPELGHFRALALLEEPR